MLERLLSNIQSAGGPVSLNELSKRIEVEQSALEPMLQLLVRRGLLTEWVLGDCEVACSRGSCGSTCTGLSGCPFVVAGLPRTLEINRLL